MPHADGARQPAALTDHLGYWLRQVSNQVSQGFAARVVASGVTVAEWVVLRTVYDHPGIAPHRLADELHMTRGAISKLAERLVDKQLLTRDPDANDQRAHHLRLTAAGRRLVPRLAALADENDAEYFGHLSDADRDSLRRVLEMLVAHHGASAPPTS